MKPPRLADAPISLAGARVPESPACPHWGPARPPSYCPKGTTPFRIQNTPLRPFHSPRSSKPRTRAPFPPTREVKKKGPSLTPTPKGSIFPENTNMRRASAVGRGATLQLWCQPCDRPAPGLARFPWFPANLDACPQKTGAWAFWRTVL